MPFFQPQFSYFPLVWMCHSKTFNVKTDLTEKARALLTIVSAQAFKICLIRADQFQCTLVICKHLLYECIKSLKVYYRRYLEIFSAPMLLQITMYVISLSLVDPY